MSVGVRSGDVDLALASALASVDAKAHNGLVRISLPGGEYSISAELSKGLGEVSATRAAPSAHRDSVSTRKGDISIVSTN